MRRRKIIQAQESNAVKNTKVSLSKMREEKAHSSDLMQLALNDKAEFVKICGLLCQSDRL
jgi:hypothetical protein